MREKSIAVLPFVNVSTDAENEYFSDGITEEIINALTTIKGLNITARTSSFAFKNRHLDIRSIGAQLGVATILEGSVRKYKNKVRITAQLIDTEAGFHLWSKTFDRELNNIFALQDEISLLIADQIRENFGHLELQDELISMPGISIEDYELYLKGKHYLHTFHKGYIMKGIALLKELVERQPQFALAYVNIHYGYNLMAAAGFLPKRSALESGLPFLERAMELDDRLPECYHSLGWHCLNENWDFAAARKHLEKALELSPAYADAHQKLFITLVLEGKKELAYQHLEKALKLDPLSPLNHYFSGYYHYLQQEFPAAGTAFRKCFEIEPQFLFGYPVYALSLVAQGKETLLLEEAERLPSIEGAEFEALLMRTLAYCSLQNRVEANPGLHRLRELLQEEESERIRFLLIHMLLLLKEEEAVLDLVDEGVAQKEPLMTLLREDPLLKPLHRYDRFQQALHKIYALSNQVAHVAKDHPVKSMQEEEIVAYCKALDRLLTEDKIFLNQSLSLRTLAERLNLHANKLSWILNERIGKNFNEYINGFRLKEFKNRALDPANSHLTLLGLAYESGFNSKTVFNTCFKKAEGVSPRAWLKAVGKAVS